jgi:hypothetical protein
MGVYGRNSYGGWSYDGTGPSLTSSSPVTASQNVGTDVLTYFTITSEAGIDPSLLNVYDGTTPIVLGGKFVGGFDGTVTAGEQDCTVVISTYPTWVDQLHTINIDVTDLAGTQDDLSYTFNTSTGGTHYDVGVADTVTASEAMVPLYAAIMGAGETVTASESLVALAAFLEGETETVTVTDATTELGVFAEAIGETVGASEALGSSKGTSEAIGETVTVTDSVQDDQGFGIPVSETVTVSEATAELTGFIEGESETVPVTDSASPSKGTSEAIGETVSVSEATTEVRDVPVGAPETVVVSEALQPQAGFVEAIGETVSVVEDFVSSEGETRDLASTVTVSDAVTLSKGTSQAVGDTVAASESVMTSQAFGVGPSESVGVSESLGVNLTAGEAVGETVPVTDDAVPSKGQSEAFGETVPVSEVAVAGLVYTVPVSEVIGVGETAAPSHGQSQTASDTVTVSEAADGVRGIEVGESESVSVSEATSEQQSFQIPETETVIVSEATSEQQSFQVPVADTVAVSESAEANQGYSEAVGETVTVVDGTGEVQGHTVLAAEVALISEGFVSSEGESRDILETVPVSDAATVLRGTSVTASETVPASEVVLTTATLSQGVSETVPVSEVLIVGEPTVSIVETVGVSETVGVLATMAEVLSEVVEIIDDVDAQKNDESRIEALPGSATRQFFRVFLIDELSWSPRGESASFTSLEIVSIDGGVPAKIFEVTREHDSYQVGTSGYLVYESSQSSNVFNFPGELAAMGYNPVGNYLEIVSGFNQGIYKITGVNSPGTGPTPILLELERELPLLDVPNGYIQGTLEYVSRTIGALTTVYVFRLDDARVTDIDPLLELFELNRRDGSLPPATTWELGSSYNTIEITVPNLPVEPGPVPWPWEHETAVLYVLTRISPKVSWRLISGVTHLFIETGKLTAEHVYQISAESLLTSDGQYVDLIGYTLLRLTDVQLPRVMWAGPTGDEGVVLVEYDQSMQTDPNNLFNAADYSITGPSTVGIRGVFSSKPGVVALHTTGLGEGDYTVTVSTSTPKDVAGNPLDPTFNAAVFTSSPPLAVRSIFTDKGPIAKPPLVLQSGTVATLDNFTEVSLTGAVLTSDHVGQYLTLTGATSTNAGTYRVSAVLSPTQARLQASFTLPDTTSFTWELFDPQNGLLADDPSDVTVQINGSPVTPEAVVGLMGQIVLNAAPAPSDDVKVDYSWCCNPTVDLRRLNSKEFRLNAYGRDQGYPHDTNQHRYRYNNVLVRPGDYKPLDSRATLDQPEERELHYRAYERAYTPVLNDPSLLVLNTPIHRIAYPPAQRQLTEVFTAYNGIGLPDAQVVDPWQRVGSGTATSSGGYLTIEDDTSGPFPTGQPLFWTRNIDVTFPHVFAMSWRFQPTVLTELDGVFSGIAAGYSDDIVAVVVGFLDDGGVKKLAILKRGYGDDPSAVTAWTGGLDATASPTDLPADFDWENDLHSYRIYRDRDGVIFVYIDGDLDPVLRVTADELPFLEELNAPFDEIQGAFFGSLSRPARSISRWDFCRYLIQPTNPVQTSTSSFVSYEANVVPEADVHPWTLVGFHGTATILSTDFLLLDSTSASDATGVGIVGGDFRGYFRFEPLLSYSSELIVDAKLQGVTHTHGLDPNGLMFAVDDGRRLMQVSFLTDLATPEISYGGRSLPGDFTPYAWGAMGSQTAKMAGRVLRVTDASTTDGLVYYYDDTQPATSDDRVVAAAIDYILEFRCKVVSYTVDGSGVAGAVGQVFDGTRSVGVLLQETGGTKYVTFQSDGTLLTQVAFDWGDGLPHTYRLTKSTSGDLVSLFIDGLFSGSLAYSSFLAPGASTTGQITFGSATSASVGSESVVDWYYCNTWRLRADLRYYVGIWRGTALGDLRDFHLPVKQVGRDATANGNALGDVNAFFLAEGVVTGDLLVVDDGPNAGVYEVAGVSSENNLTLTAAWPHQPSEVTYRIVEESDWTAQHKYRLARDSQGTVSLLRDAESAPLIQIGYTSLDLPLSGVSGIKTFTGGLPAIVFGTFDSGSLSQSSWDYVRYGLTRSPNELRIVPHHEVLNQWNVMHSPERLFTQLPHTLTDYKSSSTGQPPKTDPDFLADADLEAFTKLNQGTPIVPLTQSFEVRAPYPTTEFISALNRPEDVLNNDADFTLNDGSIRYKLIVPDDVLYSCLDIIEQTSGEQDIIAPFSDGCGCMPDIALEYTKDVCLTYDADVLPENDTAAPTPWSLLSNDPGQVSTSVFGSVLTFATGTSGTQTVYRNDTPLPDAPSLRTEAQFRMRILNDGTLGTDDTQIRAGLSAPNLTVALTFITTPLAERFILVVDLNNGNVVGSITFDFLDGAYHTYRIVRDPGAGVVQVAIDI